MKASLVHKAVVVTALLAGTTGFAADISGTWQGRSYNFSTWSTTQVYGRWGSTDFEVNRWSDSQLYGKLEGGSFEISKWSTSQFYGTTPCGSFELNVWADRQVYGKICGESIEVNGLEGPNVAYETAKDMTYDHIVGFFPSPARSWVKAQLRQIMSGSAW